MYAFLLFAVRELTFSSLSYSPLFACRSLRRSCVCEDVSLLPLPHSTVSDSHCHFLSPSTNPFGNAQVNTGVVSPPQYATVAAAATGNGATTAAQSNGGTVYLTTDYVTYRDYYSVAAAGPAGPTATLQAVGCVATSAGDQYQTVRQQLSAAPAAVTYTTATNVDSIGTEGGSFLDRYLRQGQQVVTTVNGTTIVSGGSDKLATATTINGGLTVDLPSPDSGIGGEATVTPRAVENGTIVQVIS